MDVTYHQSVNELTYGLQNCVRTVQFESCFSLFPCFIFVPNNTCINRLQVLKNASCPIHFHFEYTYPILTEGRPNPLWLPAQALSSN